MLFKRLFYITLLTICPCVNLLAQGTIHIENNLQQYQLDILNELKKEFPKNSELAIGIIHNDTIRFVGFTRNGKHWSSLDNRNSVFEIGSITKVFTSTLLANATIEGLVKIDDSITSEGSLKINGAEKRGKPITFQTLANHTSGLPRLPPSLNRSLILNALFSTLWPFSKKSENPYADYNHRKLNKYLQSGLNPKSIPGEIFHYSNLGAGLLGYLLEVRTGESYEWLLQKQIFQPYMMTSSTTHRGSTLANLVPGRNSSGKKVKNWDLGAMKAAGAVLSTVHDLSNFALANFRPDTVLAFQRQKTFTIDQSMEIGLGWFIRKYYNGEQFYWHNGGTGGYTSSMAVDINSKNSVIILTNVGGKRVLDKTCFKLMEAIRNN